MTPAELEAQESTLEFLNSATAARLARQVDALAKIDTKAVFLIGFAATTAQFLAMHKHHTALAWPGLACCAIAAYAISLLAGVQTFRVAAHNDLEPRPMIATHVRSTKSRVLIELAASRALIFEENKKRHDQERHDNCHRRHTAVTS